MKTIELLSQPLKSPEMIELLETHDAEVIFDFDRLFEGTEDSYRTAIPDLGLELIFDRDQKLKTAFVTIDPERVSEQSYEHGFPMPGELDRPGQWADVPYRSGCGTLLDGTPSRWVCLDFPAHRVHYEFRPSSLALVTLMRST